MWGTRLLQARKCIGGQETRLVGDSQPGIGGLHDGIAAVGPEPRNGDGLGVSYPFVPLGFIWKQRRDRKRRGY